LQGICFKQTTSYRSIFFIRKTNSQNELANVSDKLGRGNGLEFFGSSMTMQGWSKGLIKQVP